MGLKFNLGKHSFSTSIGTKGLSLNVGTKGSFISAGIPGTGISYRKKISGHSEKQRRRHHTQNDEANEPIVVAGFILSSIIGGILFYTTEILWLSLLVTFGLLIFFISITAQQEGEKITDENNSAEPEPDNLFPNKFGLYPHEILVLYLLPDEEHYPKYWKDRYSITNLPEIIRSLKDRNFLTVHTPSNEDLLSACSVKELRETLNAHGLKTSRKKIDMIHLILENLSFEEINQLTISKEILPNHHYALTERGKEAIKDDEYILYSHRFKGDEFDIYSLNRRMEGDTRRYQKYIWQILTEKCSEHFKAKDFGSYRSTKFHLAEFFADQHDYFSALKSLAEVIYIDINDLDSTDIPPGIIARLCEYQENLSLDNEHLAAMLAEFFRESNFPAQSHSVDECVEITLRALS